MDVFAHTLWTAAVYQKWPLRLRLWAAFFGVAPDLFSFGLFFLQNLLSQGVYWGPPDMLQIPSYVYTAYNLTHSLVVFMVVAVVLYFIKSRTLPWIIGGWGLHIVIDMFTHSREFFPTPWLWPVSDYTINSFSWAEPWFMILNYSSLIAAFIIWYVSSRHRIAKPGKNIPLSN